MFICVHCPYVVHVEKELVRIGLDYEGKIGMVAMSSTRLWRIRMIDRSK